MRTLSRPWLPDGAITAAAVRRVLAPALADWSATWFVRSTAQPSDIEPMKLPPILANTVITAGQGSVLAAIPLSAASRLSAVALAVDIPDERTAIDEALLHALAHRMLDDLARTVAKTLGPADTDGDDAQIACGIVLGAVRGLVLQLKRGTVVAAMRRLMPAAPPRSRRTDRHDALRASSLRIVAHLGKARLTVEALRNLNIGDVLVLEKKIDAPVDLVADGSSHSLAIGQLTSHDCQNAVRIQ